MMVHSSARFLCLIKSINVWAVSFVCIIQTVCLRCSLSVLCDDTDVGHDVVSLSEHAALSGTTLHTSNSVEHVGLLITLITHIPPRCYAFNQKRRRTGML